MYPIFVWINRTISGEIRTCLFNPGERAIIPSVEVENCKKKGFKSCSLPPTNRRVVQPVTWRDRLITAVIQLLFKLGGRIWDLGRKKCRGGAASTTNFTLQRLITQPIMQRFPNGFFHKVRNSLRNITVFTQIFILRRFAASWSTHRPSGRYFVEIVGLKR